MVKIAMLVIAAGLAQVYGPGVMEGEVQRQIDYEHIPPDTDPYMAVSVAGIVGCEFQGSELWALWPGGQVTGPHTVVSCSAPEDRARHIEKGLILEFHYQFAMDHGIDSGLVHEGSDGKYTLPCDGPMPITIVITGGINDLQARRGQNRPKYQGAKSPCESRGDERRMGTFSTGVQEME